MFVTYHPDYVVNIGAGHRFPMQKYGLVYEQLTREGTIHRERVLVPTSVDIPDLLLVHGRDYVERFLSGQMTSKEMRRLGFPWSLSLVRRARLAVQGTIIARRANTTATTTITTRARNTHRFFLRMASASCASHGVCLILCEY